MRPTKVMIQNKNALVRKVRDNLCYFSLSKGVAFIAPILLLKFVSLEEYGVIEFSYSFGSVIAVLAMLGLGGAYPYFILKKEQWDKEQAFMLYGFPVMGATVAVCLLRWLGVLGQQTGLVLLFTLIFALQRLYSSVLKSNDKGYLGVLVDGGYYFLLTGVILMVWLLGISHPVRLLEGAMQVYLFALAAFFIWRFYAVRTKSIRDIVRDDCPPILRYSVHLILSGILIYWLTSSARIYIGYFMGYEQVGIYSFYFRLAGVAIIIHQFLYIAFFQRLYMGDTRRLDFYYMAIMGFVLLGCLVCYLCIPLLSRYFLNGVDVNNARLFLLLTLQMPVWVGISFCEGLAGRENLVGKMNLCIGICVLIFPLVLLLLRERLTLELFTLLNAVAFSVSFMFQMAILNKRGIMLKRCFVFNLLLLSASAATYFIVN